MAINEREYFESNLIFCLVCTVFARSLCIVAREKRERHVPALTQEFICAGRQASAEADLAPTKNSRLGGFPRRVGARARNQEPTGATPIAIMSSLFQNSINKSHQSCYRLFSGGKLFRQSGRSPSAGGEKTKCIVSTSASWVHVSRREHWHFTSFPST